MKLTKSYLKELIQECLDEQMKRKKTINHKNYNFDLKKVSIDDWDGINHKDAPDYVDAYIVSATYKGRDMTDAEIDDLNSNEKYADWKYEELMDHLH